MTCLRRSDGPPVSLYGKIPALFAASFGLLVALEAIAPLGAAVTDAPIVIPSPANPETPTGRAEQLFALAQDGKLDDALAEEAAALLDHDDPFVAGIAEWAIATKVNWENNGEQVVWPCPDPPAWYEKWVDLPASFLLQADYVRQGAVWGIHHRSDGMQDSYRKILARAAGAAEDAERRGANAGTIASFRVGLQKLKELQQTAKRLAESEPTNLKAQRKLWIEARLTARQIVLANPSVSFDKLIFVTRHPALFANITGSQYPWSHKPGGDIWIRTGLQPEGKCRPVIGGRLGPGHVHGMDLWWDGDRVVFGWANQPDWPPPWDTISGDNVFRLRGNQPPTHLYEVALDGSQPEQLTGGTYWSDFEPTYCADGSVVFASDRSGRSSECGKFSADHTVINLYRWCRQTGRIHRLNDNKDIDRYPHSLDNGLIAYTRWDYQERHFLETHAVWTVRPNGTMADPVFNQHLRAPYGLRDVRSVPGCGKLVAVATGHHTLAYGPIVVIEPSRGANNPRAIQIVTPRVKPQEGPMAGVPVASGGPPDRGGVYQTPWALSDTSFLVAYSFSSSRQATGFAIYLIDVFGNKELIHRDQVYSCSFPMPLAPRQRPPELPDNRSPRKQPLAACYLSDVHRGLNGVKRGTVKYLRIAQHVGWPLAERIGAMRYLPGNAWEYHFGHWNWAPVRVIGEVPVAPDGSAYFLVPADQGIYFQALDGNHMEIRRMRSHVTLQSGETRGCTGCHETQPKTPATAWQSSMALSGPPVRPTPPPWGADRLLGYEWMIQPIFDAHCVRCHGEQQPAGGLDFSGRTAADGFLQSFRTLFEAKGNGQVAGQPLVSIVDRRSDSSVTQPKQFGSHQSRLVHVLREDDLHVREVQLSMDQWLALVTWIDANAPYHDRFYNRRPTGGGEPRRVIAPRLTDPLGSWSLRQK